MDTLTFQQLREANVPRCRSAFGKDPADWSPTDWGCAVAGEAGEACNVAKKMKRLEQGIEPDKTLTREALVLQLADEIADTVCYLDLWAASLGIDLGAAVREKFNRVSARVRSPIVLAEPARCGCTRCEEKRFAALAQRARDLERVAREQAKRSATPKTAARRFHAFESEVEKLTDALRDEIAPRTSLGIAGDLGHALGALGTIDADGCAEAAEILERLAQDERDSQDMNPPEPCEAEGAARG